MLKKHLFNKLMKLFLAFDAVLLLLSILIFVIFDSGAIAILVVILAQFFAIQIFLVNLVRRLRNIEAGEKEARMKRADILSKIKFIGKLATNIASTTGKSAPKIREIAGQLKNEAAGGLKQIAGSASKVLDNSNGLGNLSKYSDVDKLVVKSAIQNNRKRLDLNVMIIGDEFTEQALAPEWNQFAPTPENWEEILKATKIDLLFVESAWSGNGGSWKYKLVGEHAPSKELENLVAACKGRRIPTVFWNKEDPPHYEDFLETAALFDWVFTTESSKVEDYKKDLKHDRIRVLPFAVQPRFHNPARLPEVSRNGASVFGGMYFRHKYPERREQMDQLLVPAAKFGLDIYARNANEEKYRFPTNLSKYVRGFLPYSQMVAAYHAYKVTLNVNSVPSSSTMCSRRIFEATACGSAVVSANTPAIERFYPDGEITTFTDSKEAEFKIERLLKSDLFRERKVHLGQRRTFEQHTYRKRLLGMLEEIGITVSNGRPTCSVFVTTNRASNLKLIAENLRRQQAVNFEFVLLTHGFEINDEQKSYFEGIPHLTTAKMLSAPRAATLGDNLNRLVAETTGDYLFRMDDDDWYGPNYLRDLRNAIEFSSADLVGKASAYIYFESEDQTILASKRIENCYTDFVRGPTFAGPRETFEKFPFPSINRGEDTHLVRSVRAAKGLVYSADRFNFIYRRRMGTESHTWKISDLELLRSGEMAYLGFANEQVGI
ncbi:glycosyltransferase family protein [Corynebacterium glucuronolyticum]|uniref:glycosyltransferase family protein n=1 Tax=Corynebacterium glucuronolyticum TaxID=39791 RepID=UPI00223C045A|nr:glycosyltransferase [Corynebacterium glucuronolyticum]MCT1443372.1 glycosyltransferase [Corynebacterium glucuronolyticum]